MRSDEAHEFREVHLLISHLELACFEPGDVEQIVDVLEKQSGVTLDDLKITLGFLAAVSC
jgi:hypothetical protein